MRQRHRGRRLRAKRAEGLDRIAAQEFAPIGVEEVRAGEDVAPGDFATVGDDHAEDALAFEMTGLTSAPLAFGLGRGLGRSRGRPDEAEGTDGAGAHQYAEDDR